MTRACSPVTTTGALALLVLGGVLMLSAAPKTISVEVDDPRPLMEAAHLLERQLAVQVDYEDAVIESPDEMEDATDKVIREEDRKKHPERRVLIPRGGQLEVKYDVDDAGHGINADAALRQAIAAHVSKGFPGRYKLEGDDKHFHLVADEMKNAQGRFAPNPSVLSAPITFPAVPRDALETITLILNEVKAATGRKVELGMIPVNALRQTTVTVGANNEPARQVLKRAFALMQWSMQGNVAPVPKLSYDLLYDINMRVFVFNARVAMIDFAAPYGGTAQQPL